MKITNHKLKKEIVTRQKNLTFLVAIIIFIPILIAAFYPPLLPFLTRSNFFAALCILIGGLNSVTGESIAYNTFNKWYLFTPQRLKALTMFASPAKYYRVYKGTKTRVFGCLFVGLGLYLILYQPLDQKKVYTPDENYVIEYSWQDAGEEFTGHAWEYAKEQTKLGKSINAEFDIIYEANILGLQMDIIDPKKTLCNDSSELHRFLFKGKENAVILYSCDQNGNKTKTWKIQYIPKQEQFNGSQ